MTRRVPIACTLAAAAAGLAFGSPAALGARSVYLLQGEQTVVVQRDGTTLRQAITALLAGPTAAERARGLRTQVPVKVPLRSVTVEDQVATVDLGARFVNGRGAPSLSARLTQLVLTATSVPGVRSVRVQVQGGTPLGLFPGVDLTRPVTARSIRAPKLPTPATPAPPPTPATPSVQDLETRLAELGYLDAGLADGVSDTATTNAVIAFQKWQRLGRDGIVGPATTAALGTAVPPVPQTTATGTRVEVLLDRQLVLYIQDGRVVRALHTSTGRPGYETPAGQYTVQRRYTRDWSVPYSVWLPWASYFVGGVAFHESPSIPVSPASHGCVRIPAGDAQWLYDRLPVGTPVTVLRSSS